MKTIVARNVNEALYIGALLLQDHGRYIAPRGMRTVEYPKPVTTTYVRPQERVLFSAVRDANPFFHLMEALWILQGRNDVAFLKKYNKRMAEFSDDGIHFHAPYGARIAEQIEPVLHLLRRDPNTRRAVLQIWDWKQDLNKDSVDIPCNDLIFLKIREGKLLMTVCNRSNDMIWGAYGANAVQFSMLQEYLALRLGVEIGTYAQVSDSFHAYMDGPGGKKWADLRNNMNDLAQNIDVYEQQDLTMVPLFENYAEFAGDMDLWFNAFDAGEDPYEYSYSTPFFNDVVIPMALAWDVWKREKDCQAVKNVLHDHGRKIDWRMAGLEWMTRRVMS